MKGKITIRGGRIDIPMVLKRVLTGGGDGLKEAAIALQRESDARTPLDTGRLVGTSELYMDDAGLLAVVSYATPYATIIHEQPELNFQNGREGKWLQHSADKLGGDGSIEVKIGDGLSRQLR